MELLESTNEYLQPFINLKGLLDNKVDQESRDDFLTFVRRIAPMLVSDWRMGRHIEVISDKLKELGYILKEIDSELIVLVKNIANDHSI